MGIVKDFLKSHDVTEKELTNVMKMWKQIDTFQRQWSNLSIDFSTIYTPIDIIEDKSVREHVVVVFHFDDKKRIWSISEVIIGNKTYVDNELKTIMTSDNELRDVLELSLIKRVYCYDNTEGKRMFQEFVMRMYPNFKELYEDRDDDNLIEHIYPKELSFDTFDNNKKQNKKVYMNKDDVNKLENWFVEFISILYRNINE